MTQTEPSSSYDGSSDELATASPPDASVQDLRMMMRCLQLAERGAGNGELPFAAVVASRGEVIAESANRVSSERDVTRHAEIVALSKAQKVTNRRRLTDCTLYSIVEPCPMCSFPAREARIGRVVFALSSPIMGGHSRWNVLRDAGLSTKLPEVFGPPPEIVSGFLSEEAEQVWRQWSPLAWRFMKRRGCFGTEDSIHLHAAARRPIRLWPILTALLVAPALSASKALSRRRAASDAVPTLEPGPDQRSSG
jgi:tRNA(adenine34) deaminase